MHLWYQQSDPNCRGSPGKRTLGFRGSWGLTGQETLRLEFAGGIKRKGFYVQEQPSISHSPAWEKAWCVLDTERSSVPTLCGLVAGEADGARLGRTLGVDAWKPAWDFIKITLMAIPQDGQE